MDGPEHDDAVAVLAAAGVGRGTPVALTIHADAGAGLVTSGRELTLSAHEAGAGLRAIEEALHPRWVVWSHRDLDRLLALGVQIGSCWSVAAVHRLTAGGWRASPAVVWAHHRGLDPETVPEPTRGAVDLFTAAAQAEGDPDDPVRADGHLRPEWGRGEWDPTPTQLVRWAALALEVADAQAAERAELAADPGHPRALVVARSESTAEVLCAELAAWGLPIDRAVAEEIVAAAVGPRPADEAEAEEIRRTRDREVLRHVPTAHDVDLRSPGQVKSLLRRAGIEVEDTRAWRLERLAGTHPVVEPLLRWRKAERIGTTFGYQWLDEHVGGDDRLRGGWTASDGAAGRMTASAGLHNMPAELRPAVVAEPGHAFVRADLGQIEPRVLAAVSGDDRLAAASTADDLYADVASTLGVERDIAKVAVLGAMYGQTTGRGAEALVELRRAYPTAVAFLDQADHQARRGVDLRTYGGRRIRLDSRSDLDLPEPAARSRAAARGRYGRNAVIQGAAAELFKMWALTVRARTAELGAEVVLCLHDELLVHAPVASASAVAGAVDDALDEAVHRWAPDPGRVRFLADTAVIARWSDAKN